MPSYLFCCIFVVGLLYFFFDFLIFFLAQQDIIMNTTEPNSKMEVIIALVCVSVILVMLGAMAFVLGLLIGYKLRKPQSEISVGEHRVSMTDQVESEDVITETQSDPMYEEILQEKPATIELTENIAYAPLTQ